MGLVQTIKIGRPFLGENKKKKKKKDINTSFGHNNNQQQQKDCGSSNDNSLLFIRGVVVAVDYSMSIPYAVLRKSDVTELLCISIGPTMLLFLVPRTSRKSSICPSCSDYDFSLRPTVVIVQCRIIMDLCYKTIIDPTGAQNWDIVWHCCFSSFGTIRFDDVELLGLAGRICLVFQYRVR